MTRRALLGMLLLLLAVAGSGSGAERSGRLQERLRERFKDQYRADVDLFWEASDPPLRAPLMAHVDREALFAYFRGSGSVFPPASVTTSCAVVGASSNLSGSRLGAEIDGHDVVLRVNLAPTRGFEADVGRKTTHYLVTQWILGAVLGGNGRENVSADLDGRLLSLDPEAYWLLLFRPIDEESTLQEVGQQLRSLERGAHPVPRDRSRLVHPEFALHVADWKTGSDRDPSTGFVGVMLAVHACDAVDIYGFGPDAKGSRGYYYKPGVHEEHGPDHEDLVLRRLAAESVIGLRAPEAAGGAARQ